MCADSLGEVKYLTVRNKRDHLRKNKDIYVNLCAVININVTNA